MTNAEIDRRVVYRVQVLKDGWVNIGPPYATKEMAQSWRSFAKAAHYARRSRVIAVPALAWAEAKPPRKKTIVEIVQERGGTIDPNHQSPEAFLRTCGPFQGDVDGDDAEAKKGEQP